MSKHIFKRLIFSALISLLLGSIILFTPAGLYGYFFNRNFQTVVTGEVYRSAQPEIGDIDRWVAQHGIKTIINLRGNNPQKAWYQMEVEDAKALGVTHLDVRMNSEKLPSARVLKQLVALLDTAERPVLVHCKGGVHRSGLAGVSTLLLAGETLASARLQFSPAKGFLSWIDNSHVPDVFRKYEVWLGRNPHTLDKFKTWINEIYVPYFYSAKITLEQPLLQVKPGESQQIHVMVKNTSPGPIDMKPGAGLGVRLGARVFWSGDKHFIPGVKNWLVESRELATDLLLMPGKSIALNISMPAVQQSGEYDLVIDLVDEQVAWFEKMGSQALIIPLTVSEEL